MDIKKDDFIPVKDFAKLINKSEQSIYKRLNKEDNPLKVFARNDTDGLKISKTALYAVYRN